MLRVERLSIGIVTSSDLIALVSVVVSPTSVLVAVWLTSLFAARQKSADAAEATRAEALAGFAHFAALGLDAEPTLVASGSIREYSSPEGAVAGLCARWVAAREPLVQLGFAHPSKQVRGLALSVQALLELTLRQTEDAIKTNGDLSTARITYGTCIQDLGRLGQLLTENEGERAGDVSVTSRLKPPRS